MVSAVVVTSSVILVDVAVSIVVGADEVSSEKMVSSGVDDDCTCSSFVVGSVDSDERTGVDSSSEVDRNVLERVSIDE